ncbi:hypothetical protein Hdeb2414_s0026g00679141 [Helianthus debilis subsp. tardiflorus]
MMRNIYCFEGLFYWNPRKNVEIICCPSSRSLPKPAWVFTCCMAPLCCLRCNSKYYSKSSCLIFYFFFHITISCSQSSHKED